MDRGWVWVLEHVACRFVLQVAFILHGYSAWRYQNCGWLARRLQAFSRCPLSLSGWTNRHRQAFTLRKAKGSCQNVHPVNLIKLSATDTKSFQHRQDATRTLSFIHRLHGTEIVCSSRTIIGSFEMLTVGLVGGWVWKTVITRSSHGQKHQALIMAYLL